MIETKQLYKSYGALPVLKGIDLTIQKKEVVAIVGASGAGKSTLLHLLGTLDKPDQGTITWNGIDPFSLSQKKLAAFRNQHIGFVFQFHHLLPEFSAIENVMIPALMARQDVASAKKKAHTLLEKLHVAERANNKPAQLSGGESQRVAVARALINEPQAVLADEPSGNLDSHHAKELHELIVQLRDELGQTFIIVTHNAELANRADRKIEMKDGLLV